MKGRNDVTETIMLFVAIFVFGSMLIATCYCLYSFGKDGPEIHTRQCEYKHEVVEVVSCEYLNDADKYNVTVSLNGKEESFETFKEHETRTMIPVTVRYLYVDGKLITKECIGIDYF